jgi:hypothetical protein
MSTRLGTRFEVADTQHGAREDFPTHQIQSRPPIVCFPMPFAPKQTGRNRPDYVTPDRRSAQDRTFGFAPISLKNSETASQASSKAMAGKIYLFPMMRSHSRGVLWAI